MTTNQFNDQASSLGFQVLFLFLMVVTVVFISLGKEVGGGGGGGFYHTVVIQKLVHFNCLLFMPTLSCDQLINNETISSSWNMEAPYLISWKLTKGVLALLPKRLFFPSTIMKAWHRLWARWGKNTHKGQFTGVQEMVHILPIMSTLLIMPTVTATQKHAWAISTLFHLQCRTGTQFWPGLRPSHLMRRRYFILTHPAKYKRTQTIIHVFITVKSESEAIGSLI